MSCLCELMKSDTKNGAMLINVARGLANFGAFQQNSDKLVSESLKDCLLN